MESIYEAPKSTVAKTEESVLEAMDYYALYPLASGRKKVLVLFWYLILQMLFIVWAGFLVAAERVAVNLIPVAIVLVVYAAVAYAVYSSSKVGLYVGVVISVINLAIIPIGTIIGLISFNGLFQSKEVYFNQEYSFSALRNTYKKYT